MNSFEIALEQLKNNAVNGDGVRAMKVCNAADDLASMLKSAAMALELAGLIPGNDYWQQQCRAAAREARRVLAEAIGEPS